MIWLWMALVVLGALLIASLWWWRHAIVTVPAAAPSPHVAGDAASPPAPSAHVVPTTAPADVAVDPVVCGSRVDSPRAPLRPKVAARTSAPTAATSVEQAELPSDARFDSVEREALPTPPPATALPAVTNATHVPLAIAPPELEAPTETERVSRVGSAPEIDDLPRLDQLSRDERNALPPLKLSMHVYGAQTTDRFVLIDGRRYREGEKISPALQILEIRRDGVVLDLSGKSFLLRRP
jgi:general secretion pathway protein B